MRSWCLRRKDGSQAIGRGRGGVARAPGGMGRERLEPARVCVTRGALFEFALPMEETFAWDAASGWLVCSRRGGCRYAHAGKVVRAVGAWGHVATDTG